MKQTNDFFIFTEIVHCGQIGKIALRSFFAYHPKAQVHVFGLESDREAVAEFPAAKVIFHSLDKPDPNLEGWPNNIWQRQQLLRRFKRIGKNFGSGHFGTGSLWAQLIQTRPEKYLIHFDSDVIFRAEALSDITESLSKGYDLVGPIRNYKNNPHGDKEAEKHEDVTGTYFFGFNKDKISTHSYKELTEMCRGRYNPLGFPVLDFFDPIAFEILHNQGKLFHLSVDDYGGADLKGGRVNKYPKLNPVVDFGDKMSHFSAVGSGMNFYKNRGKIRDVPDVYVQYGLEKYSVYMKLFYKQDIGVPFDMKKYGPLFKVKKWY